MTHQGSKRESVYSNNSSLDIQNNGLFPTLYPNQNRLLYHDPNQDINEGNEDHGSQEYDITSKSDTVYRNNRQSRDNNSLTSSIQNFGEIFNKNNSNNEYDLTDNLFQSNFDSDLESNMMNSVNESTVSIDENIINKLNIDSIENESSVNNLDDQRFKYLKNYQMLKKQQNKTIKVNNIMNKIKNNDEIPLETYNDSSSMISSKSSIFNLSSLNDYNKYIKMTEINELIKKKLFNKINNDNDNLLSIVESKDLAQNYINDQPEGSQSPSSLQQQQQRNQHQQQAIKRQSSKSNWCKSKLNLKSNWYKPNFVNELNYEQNEISTPSTSSIKDETNPQQFLQRKLKVRHLQMISFGGTLGVGLFLNSGKAFTIAGGFGTLLAFCICGIIVLSTIVSFCEMVTFVSVVDGVSGLSSRFVDDSFGFAVGWLYFLSFAFGLAGEVVASVILLTYFPNLNILSNKGSTVGFVTFFLVSILMANLFDVRIFGEIEYISSLIKLICALIMIIVMIIYNRGGIGNNAEVLGFKYWQYSKSDFDHNLIFGLFRPTFNLRDSGMNDPQDGIGSNKGRFLSLITAIMVVSFAYSGTEIVCIAACEAKNPRKALPSATRRVFWRILIFYCLSSFLVSINIYSGDPRLLRYYTGLTGISASDFSSNYAIKYVGGDHCNTPNTIFAGIGSGSQSPWTIALQSSGLCKFSSIANGFLVFFAVSCGNAQLYVSSRTLYSLALQKKAPKFMTYCNKSGIPYNAVLFSASFGLLSFIVVSERATDVFQNLTSIIASSGIIVWFAMCLSFLRFYYGLKIRPDIISRDDKAYPYKSPFQPYSAFIGLFGSAFIILGMGFVVFLKDEWDTLFFFSSYGTLIIFVVLYFAYKILRGTRIPSLETLDFDSGRREFDRYIWDGGRDYNPKNFKELAQKFISSLA